MATTCPVTRNQFKTHAKQIEVVIDGQKFVVDPREFSTKSLGWNLNGKSSMDIGGECCQLQIGMNVTIIGSKDVK